MSARSLNLSVHRAREAVDALSSAFMWDQSPQGLDYWHDVVRNILALIKEHEAEEQTVSEQTP